MTISSDKSAAKKKNYKTRTDLMVEVKSLKDQIKSANDLCDIQKRKAKRELEAKEFSNEQVKGLRTKLRHRETYLQEHEEKNKKLSEDLLHAQITNGALSSKNLNLVITNGRLCKANKSNIETLKRCVDLETELDDRSKRIRDLNDKLIDSNSKLNRTTDELRQNIQKLEEMFARINMTVVAIKSMSKVVYPSLDLEPIHRYENGIQVSSAPRLDDPNERLVHHAYSLLTKIN